MTSPVSAAPPTAEDITRASRSNLAFAFLCLPPPKRRDMSIFYAFCRIVDDIADDPATPAEEKAEALHAWAGLIDERREPSPGFESDFSALLRRHPIPREHLHEILRGMEMDIRPRRYRTLSELEVYCYRVASAVGLVSIEIFGYTRPETMRYAVELGHALQLTNILRDVAEDLREDGRIYLPLEDLERFGISQDGLEAAAREGKAFLELMAFEAERAEARFAAARDLLTPEDRPSLVASESMRAIYDSLLQKMKRDGFRVFDKRYRVGKLEKLGHLLWESLRVARRK